MALRILDGPAAGAKLACRRAPYFLRIVIHRTTGKVDALDQLGDSPLPGEAVHVYEAVPGSLMTMKLPPGTFLCGRSGALFPSADGEYRHRADVDGETLRETDAWRAWARAQVPPEGVELVDGVTREPHGTVPHG